MKTIFLLLATCALSLAARAQPWVFYPSQTTTEFYDGSAWGLSTNQSSRTDFVYVNDRIESWTNRMWNGSSFVLNTSCVKMEYVYNGNDLDQTVLKFWNGNAYVLTDNSVRTQYTYNGGLVDYTTTEFWDTNLSTWYLGYQWIGAVSTRTEHYYNGQVLDHTITKFWDGSAWYLGYQVIGVVSNKTEYFYNAGKLDYTISKLYDGTNWYIAYQVLGVLSVRTEYNYVGNDLDHTITKYWDGSAWYIGYQVAGVVSVKTLYQLHAMSVEDNGPGGPGSTLAPNPSADRAILRTDRMLMNATLQVLDPQGRVVLRMDGLQGQDIVLHRDGLPRGHYTLRLADQDGTLTVLPLVFEP